MKFFNQNKGFLSHFKSLGGRGIHLNGESRSTGLKSALAGLLLIALTVGSCGTTKILPVETETKVNYIDSTIFHIDTMYVEIPREIYKDYTGLLDTLRLETTVANSRAWVDTTAMMLKGELENKTASLEKEIIWKERVVYRDSIQVKEVPYPVETIKEVVPTWSWWSLALNLLIIVGIIIKIYLKLHSK